MLNPTIALRASVVLAAALLGAACAPDAGPDDTASGGEGGSVGAGSGGSVGTGGQAGASSGGRGGAIASGGAGGATTPDAAIVTEKDAPSAVPDSATADRAAVAEAGQAGGQALLVVGKVPLIGSDIQIHEQLASRGLTVEDLLDSMASTASAAGKRIVVISYSVDSEEIGGKFNDVKVPLIVMEHNLLPTLGMANAHGYTLGVNNVTIPATAGPLAGGLTGDVAVFTKTGEVFWGTPAAGALIGATVKGKPVTFGYAEGAMMMTKPAPAKRLNFFLGAHLVPDKWLNANGLKLLDASIDWCVAP